MDRAEAVHDGASLPLDGVGLAAALLGPSPPGVRGEHALRNGRQFERGAGRLALDARVVSELATEGIALVLVRVHVRPYLVEDCAGRLDGRERHDGGEVVSGHGSVHKVLAEPDQ
eukprot:3922839-Prymnesium_polylepis.4